MTDEPEMPFEMPRTISAEARAYFEAARPLAVRSAEAETIDQTRRETREGFAPASRAAQRQLAKRVEEIEISGVPVQEIVPAGYRPGSDDEALLYLFGGGYIVGSPFEDLPISASLAHHLGVRTYVPHYRLAPEHPYPAALDDASAVFRALMDRVGPSRLAIAGESAGGNLALATLLRARREGRPLAAAAALLSPWCDLSKTGNSTWAPEGFDPSLDYDKSLRAAATAFAGDLALQDPLVSPLYADYGADFPPTLITCGTRDLFLSDCARLSRRLRRAGVRTSLHLWEGLWHVFEFYPQLPEAQDSLAEIAAFLAENAFSAA